MPMVRWILRRRILAGALIVPVLLLTGRMALAREAVGHHNIQVSLAHTPHGAAVLRWSPRNQHLVVTITLTGLAPNSTHPAHIHKGNCSMNGQVVYPLNNVVADKAGNAVSTTEIAGVGQGIPASDWSVNVHNGPGLTPAAQYTPITCGNVQDVHSSKDHAEFAFTILGTTNAANQYAYGMARLTLDAGLMTVLVTLHGLVPGSSHAVHIHAGSCQRQIPGTVVYTLKNLVADNAGHANVMTVIKGVKSIPASGWYVNIHFSTDLSTQTGFDPIACGNV